MKFFISNAIDIETISKTYLNSVKREMPPPQGGVSCRIWWYMDAVEYCINGELGIKGIQLFHMLNAFKDIAKKDIFSVDANDNDWEDYDRFMEVTDKYLKKISSGEI